MVTTTINISIVYDGELSLQESTELFDRIKGQLGTRLVVGFHFEGIHEEADVSC